MKIYNNITLNNVTETLPYTPKKQMGASIQIPERDRKRHGEFLKSKLENIKNSLKKDKGVYLDIEGAPNFNLKTESLESIRDNTRLLNIKTRKNEKDEEITVASLFVPTVKFDKFIKKVDNYLDKTKDNDKGKPKNRDLVESIENIKIAVIDSLWCDEDGEKNIPTDNVSKWCEVWIRNQNYINPRNTNNASELINDNEAEFINICENSNIILKNNKIRFPEKTVFLIKANRKQLLGLLEKSNQIEEFRNATELATFYINLSPKEQSDWCIELLDRLNIKSNINTSICLLDSGVNNGHILLKPVLADDNCLTYNADWGTSDSKGHGTEMAGISTYFDLNKVLESSGEISINHILESVKIVQNGQANEPQLYGDITSQAINRAELNNPHLKRVICMAVTAENIKDGKPTSWSGAVDSLSFGTFAEESNEKRLIIISAGNVDISDFKNVPYPELNKINQIQNPAQAWNAITVGAYTRKANIQDSIFNGYNAIAEPYLLSPYSRTSCLWDNKWPIKPDIVCEGGNIATNGIEYDYPDDLSLLTTSKDVNSKSFSTINATSSATAQASYIAAEIQENYPEYWPETIRALMINSADWTSQMLEENIKRGNKTEYLNLLRIYGYGIPNLKKAIRTANNSINMVIQSELQPYEKIKKDKIKDMNLHSLPWPKDALLSLGDTEVKMKITLSYFIEPRTTEK